LQIVRGLPADFAAPICIVLHIPADSPSLLAQILARHGVLPAKHAEDGDTLEPGHIYVAPPDRHLLVTRHGTARVARGPRENRHRPAVDPLFRSAALAYANRAIAIVLSGALDDGTAGLLAVKQRGGMTIVQDPLDAMYPSMPQNAIQHVEIDHCIPVARLAVLLTHVVAEDPPPAVAEISHNLVLETRMAELDAEALATDERPGEPSPYSCPDCGGVLWEINDGEYSRFRCRVGHAFSPETALGAQEDKLEEALWSAVKTLEESARLSQRLAATELTRGNEWLSKRFAEKERDARHRVEVIRRFLIVDDDGTTPVAAPRQQQAQERRQRS
jgi:two-component system chemotaxis response regulator CheB